MAVANFFKLIVLVLIPAAIAGLAALIYLPAYKKKINARLGNFGSDFKAAKPVTPPAKVFLIAFLAVSVAFLLIIAILITAYKTNTRSEVRGLDGVEQPYCWVRQVVTESMLDKYTPGEEIPGYRITQSKQENGLELYFYVGNDGEVGGFPQGLIGVRNTNDEPFFMETHDRQTGAQYPDYDGGFIANYVEDEVMWCTVSTFNFFGTMDIKVENISKLNDDEDHTFDDLRSLGTGKTVELHLELDKEFDIEGWYDKPEND